MTPDLLCVLIYLRAAFLHHTENKTSRRARRVGSNMGQLYLGKDIFYYTLSLLMFVSFAQIQYKMQF